ncbi:sugar-binding transcriptional regulator [Roseospira marina]|uniref:Sugar-binding transcriptional regulator n=1 Tax=Roseospira marina TaxID=140057 RepID=A0A5M6IDY2_9PROT|nr:sugar-binding transcriptional regulator [Roseospira marina]KAA5606282.1 sugar-binding transcriptional regulator [Roseospira marina]MBB4314440.1 DNA-binding transcriptional regulator LsrR (DeoR family) [Roseospira marina]MBB5087600.1 DNA-binding transcriptional regulator LsrR (DeoR family) [Roseospira marina]
MSRKKASNGTRLDDAARAGWLYYVAGNTQEDIAEKMGMSRQAVQRLVSLSVSEGLVKVRLDHPIARCLDLAARVKDRCGLRFCEVVPTDPDTESSTLGVAEAGATEIERHLLSPDSRVIAIGTGRTLKAAIGLLPPITAPDKQVVSLTGNIAPDGSLAFYSAIFSMAELVTARHYLMPCPVVAASVEERDRLRDQPVIRASLSLARHADVVFVGLGDLGPEAPLFVDGFITPRDLQALRDAGAVGEIIGWAFDGDGRLIACDSNARVVSAALDWPDETLVIAMAKGERKVPGLHAVIRGKLVNGLITDEGTAIALLGEE